MPVHTTEKDLGWLLPPGNGRKALKAGLYLVATPIGNLGDITLRALETLSACDVVVCEDTRVTGKLLSHYGIKKPLLACHDYNETRQIEEIVSKIKQGQALVLTSDAGTPLISDPGYKLVQACRAAGVYVTALPGANAPLTALQLSGLAPERFCFLGFLPAKAEACGKILAPWKTQGVTLVAFETAPRLLKTLGVIHKIFGDCTVVVARELTKLYEEVRSGDVAVLIEHYEKAGAPKGEIVLVIAPPEPQAASADEIASMLKDALKAMSVKEAAAFVAAQTGLPKKEMYAKALELKK